MAVLEQGISGINWVALIPKNHPFNALQKSGLSTGVYNSNGSEGGEQDTYFGITLP